MGCHGVMTIVQYAAPKQHTTGISSKRAKSEGGIPNYCPHGDEDADSDEAT